MNVFAYGTLLFPEVVESLTHRQFEYEDVRVDNFERRTILGKIYPGIVDAQGSLLAGRIYFDLDTDSLAVLDAFEDDIYERRKLEVLTLARGVVSALAYVIPQTLTTVLSPNSWEPMEFERDYLQQYVQRCSNLRVEILKLLQTPA